MADSGQRTEQATPKRLDKARKEGQFPTARQFVPAVQFLVFVALLEAWGGQWFGELRSIMRQTLAAAFSGRPEVVELEAGQTSVGRCS